MKKIIKKNNKGFAILFAVTLSAILLSIALGVTEIAYKQLKFSTSAKSTNDAFFAADTGMECALFHDKSTIRAFRPDVVIEIECASQDIMVDYSADDTYTSYDFLIPNLGSNNSGCARVTLTRDESFTTVVSKGYDNCDSPNQIERQIETTY